MRDSTARRGAVLGEALVIALAGFIIALIANAVSPRGLSLARNYFPGESNRVVAPLLTPHVEAATNASAGGTTEAAWAERIRSRGFGVADHEEAVRWFHDERYVHQGVVFIDARDPEHYRAGHIPGASEFDPYHPELEIASVLPLSQAAEAVLVYCTGGDCEDSQFAATILAQAGIPKEKLNIYIGGFRDWESHGLPVESGERNSGTFRGSK